MINRLFKWLDASTCNVMAVETMKTELEKSGFSQLCQEEAWNLEKGGKY